MPQLIEVGRWGDGSEAAGRTRGQCWGRAVDEGGTVRVRARPQANTLLFKVFKFKNNVCNKFNIVGKSSQNKIQYKKIQRLVKSQE